LSKALDSIHYSSTRINNPSSDAILSRKLAEAGLKAPTSDDKKTTEKTLAPPTSLAPPSGLLEHAASFDTRLALIEASLGISTGSNPFFSTAHTQQLRPVLPALEHLTSQLTALTSTLGGPTNTAPSTASITTTAQLESLSARIKKLTADAENLATSRRRAAEAAARQTDSPPADAFASSPSATEVNADAGATSSEQAAKIQALYATLPTIQSLHPLLPSVLERLRSLRAIHAGAAQASETLDALENDQAEMSKEIEQWREGLKMVEAKVRESEVSTKKNIEYVGPWVDDLKKRMDSLESL
jgi:nuclear migration protein JNM1